ncbi:hypothetical protein [Heliorestis convoluta]|uniref:CNNM transmembrane domain-containing protein n=1 Tax=Heliorestis convoluta TaxID=356322 RepID=A0A5Q2N007_9FIRM|nr:hypothetical protein [Heliorestis convoluta]QGG46542.1 hypothetical protein FTV88_0363 [Heliorestis convoluta]
MGPGLLRDLRQSARHAALIGLLSFFIAMGITVGSDFVLSKVVSISLSIVVLLILIFTGVLFDTIGTSAAAATEIPFHAKAARKTEGAQQALWIVRNADRVANFCNDVIGDIAAAVAGAIGISIAIRLAQLPGAEGIYWGVIITGFVAALTVGGKSLGKMIAINYSHEVVFIVARWLARFEALTGRNIFQMKKKKVYKRGSKKEKAKKNE